MTYRRASKPRIIANAADRAQLERWVRAATTPQRVVRRSRIVLLWLEGLSSAEVAARAGVSQPTARLWIRRFSTGGPDNLLRDAPGRGRPRVIDASDVRARLLEAELIDQSGHIVNLERAAELLHVSTSTVWRAMRRAPLP